MPIYDYSCTVCGHLVEVIHGIHEHGPRFCPECGAEGTMKKGFATPAVHFKGSGWAKKDRKATSVPGRSSASSAKETTTDAAKETTTDAPKDAGSSEAATGGGGTPAGEGGSD